MSARRAARTGAAAVATLIVVLAVLAAATTGVDVQPLAKFSGPEPVARWSQPCWRRGAYTLPCARVSGRVVFRQLVDPDGDGDHHLVVIAGMGIVTLKLRASRHLTVPGYGAHVVAVGRYSEGAGQLGSDVVDVSLLEK